VPCSLQAAPTYGRRCIARASATTMPACAGKARVSQGMQRVACPAMERCPSGSTRMPRLPVRYACTMRYTRERGHNRTAAISVGLRPAAPNCKMWNASR
jgi:hypothetical protein